MLRETFGETDSEVRPPQTPHNTTPLFRLAAVMPEFAGELSRLLAEQGETALAAAVPRLQVFDRCRCNAGYCATIYTLPKPEAGFKGAGGLTVLAKTGPVYIDTSDGMIACIEALDQPAIRKKLVELLP